MIALVIGIWVLSAGLSVASSPAATETIRVVGKSVKSKQGLAKAREAAIENGLTNAVSQAVLTTVSSDQLVTHFEAVVSLFDQQADSYIKRYKVLAERDAEKEYHVLIEAVVMRARIKKTVDKADLTAKDKLLPTILFLITEKTVGETSPRFWWHPDGAGEVLAIEKALALALGDKGYAIVNHSSPLENGIDRTDLSAAEAAGIGRQYHADVVITGRAMARIAKNTRVTNLKTYEGALTVRAYRVESGAQIAVSHAQAVSVNTDSAAGAKSVLSLVANDVAADVARQLSARQQRPEKLALSPITIDVSGTDQLRSFVKLRRALNTMPGVERMQIKALTPPQGTLVVFFRGSAGKMAENLTHLKSDTLNIQVDQTGIDQVKVTLLP